MKTEIRKKLVEYIVYIAEDGKEFENEIACRQHEKELNGEIKECPDCKGTGKYREEVPDEDYHTGAPCTRLEFYTCKTCNGKGYLEKKIKVVWE